MQKEMEKACPKPVSAYFGVLRALKFKPFGDARHNKLEQKRIRKREKFVMRTKIVK